jgi:hypothetical protein
MRYMESPLHDFVGGVPCFFAGNKILPEASADFSALKHTNFFSSRDGNGMICARTPSCTFVQNCTKVLVIGKPG